MNLWKHVFRLYHFEMTYRDNMWCLCIGNIDHFVIGRYVAKPTKKQIRQFKNNFYRGMP